MTDQEFYISLRTRLKGVATSIEPQEYEEIKNTVVRETGWAFPVSGNFKEFWTLKRGVRHALALLLVEAAAKFKYKQINLQHRFEHYQQLVKDEDEQFKAAIEENPAEFGGVEIYKMFGTKVAAGFSYDIFGRDTTYSKSNRVDFSPDETD